MHSTWITLCVGNNKGKTELKAMCDWYYQNSFFFLKSKGQGVISAFSKGQGVTKRGQGAAPCKRSLGRTLNYILASYHLLEMVSTDWSRLECRHVGSPTPICYGTDMSVLQRRSAIAPTPQLPNADRSLFIQIFHIQGSIWKRIWVCPSDTL